MSKKSLPGWTRILADRMQQETFITDMNRIRELGSAFTGARAWQQDTVYTQLCKDMSLEARKAVLGAWPTTAAHFRLLWDAA